MNRKVLRCPYCPCLFFSARDYAFHQQAHIIYPERFAKMNRDRQKVLKDKNAPTLSRGSIDDMFADEEKLGDDEELGWEE